MVQPHPSLLLVLNIDESLATQETRLEIKRSYGYVGSTVIRPHEAAPEGEIVNTVEMHVKLPGVEYLRKQTQEADALWNDMIKRWLYNQFHTLGNQMQIYNRRQREEGNVELYFDWLNVIFEDGAFTVKVRLNSVSSLPPECAEVFSQLRSMLRDGTIGEDVNCVLLPAVESFENQVRAWEDAEPERQAKQAAEEQAIAEEAALKAQEAAKEAEENFTEAPDLLESQPAEFDEESWQAELERKYSLPDPDFDIDYAMWGIVQSDGSIKTFDSLKRCYVNLEEAAQIKGADTLAQNTQTKDEPADAAQENTAQPETA